MEQLSAIALLLLFGTLFSILAYKLKVSNVFFLLFAGMMFAILGFKGLGEETIIVISELALIMVIFDSTSKLHFKEILKYSTSSVKLSGIFFLLCISIITVLGMTLIGLEIVPALLLSVLVYGIDPAVALSVLGKKKIKTKEILEIEAIINTPLIPILALLLLNAFVTGTTGDISTHFLGLLQQFFVPIGVGVVFGGIIVHIMKHHFYEEVSHLLVITSSVITYVLAEIMNGSGVLAVTTFGLIFGNYHVKHQIELEKFASIFANTLKILVFILLGTVIINFAKIRTGEQILYGSLLFIAYLIIRYIAVYLSVKQDFRKRLFMTLNSPKGIDVSVIILLIISQVPTGLEKVINIALLFVLYSIVLSTISSLFNDYFFSHKQA